MATSISLDSATLQSDGTVQVSLTYSCDDKIYELRVYGSTDTGKHALDAPVSMTRDGSAHQATASLESFGGLLRPGDPFAKGEQMAVRARIFRDLSSDTLLGASTERTFTLT